MFADTIIKDIKFNMIQLIKDIESLTSIDYPKMLSMDVILFIFSYRYLHMNPCIMKAVQTHNKIKLKAY